jgi:cell fate (sporulation/competence/biofilm development) regulator YlbF (YheA/YmcA/DUF963 family)
MYLKAAHEQIGADPEASEKLGQVRKLQEELLDCLERGEEPPAEMREQLAALNEEVQASSRYQSLIAAQTNFDKLMEKVNQAIGKGIKAGQQSRIILSS